MIPLPLDTQQARCQGNGQRVGSVCHLRNNCARFLTMRHDQDRTAIRETHYRACQTELMAMHIPMEGFPKRDEDQT